MGKMKKKLKTVKKVAKTIKKVKKAAKTVKKVKKIAKNIKKAAKIIKNEKKPVKIKPQAFPTSGKITDAQLLELNKKIISKTKIKEGGISTIRFENLLKCYRNYELTPTQIDLIENDIRNFNVKLIGNPDSKDNPLYNKLQPYIKESKSANSKSVAFTKKMFSNFNVNDMKILSDEEELQCLKNLTSPVKILRQIATRKLLMSNMKLIVSLARGHCNKGLDQKQLIALGENGFMEALSKYDMNKKNDKGERNKLTTYATWWIRMHITKGIQEYGKTIKIPVHISEIIKVIKDKEIELTNKLFRKPSIEELSEALTKDSKKNAKQYTVANIIKYKQLSVNTISLDKGLKTDSESSVADFVPEEEDDSYVKKIKEKEYKEYTKKVLCKKDENGNHIESDEYKVYTMRIGLYDQNKEQYTLDDIARKLNKTKEQVRTLEEKAKRLLKEHPDYKYFKHYKF